MLLSSTVIHNLTYALNYPSLVSLDIRHCTRYGVRKRNTVLAVDTVIGERQEEGGRSGSWELEIKSKNIALINEELFSD